MYPSGLQLKTPAAIVHINNEIGKIWALAEIRLRRLGLTAERPLTQTIPAYYGTAIGASVTLLMHWPYRPDWKVQQPCKML